MSPELITADDKSGAAILIMIRNAGILKRKTENETCKHSEDNDSNLSSTIDENIKKSSLQRYHKSPSQSELKEKYMSLDEFLSAINKNVNPKEMGEKCKTNYNTDPPFVTTTSESYSYNQKNLLPLKNSFYSNNNKRTKPDTFYTSGKPSKHLWESQNTHSHETKIIANEHITNHDAKKSENDHLNKYPLNYVNKSSNSYISNHKTSVYHHTNNDINNDVISQPPALINTGKTSTIYSCKDIHIQDHLFKNTTKETMEKANSLIINTTKKNIDKHSDETDGSIDVEHVDDLDSDVSATSEEFVPNFPLTSQNGVQSSETSECFDNDAHKKKRGGGKLGRKRRRGYIYDPKPLIRKKKTPKTEPATKDTEYWDKRQRNNEAAKRSRENRRQKELEIIEKAKILASENEEFRRRIKELEDKNAYLERLLSKKVLSND